MTDLQIGALAIVLMLAGIYFGMHIGVALIVTSFLSVWLVKSPEVAARFVAASANDAIRDYLFGVIPLFVLMGMLVSVSGVGRDTFDVFQWLMRRIRGGLGLATVGANAVFAAITGISIASASVFTKVAVPEMMRHGYTARFAVGDLVRTRQRHPAGHTRVPRYARGRAGVVEQLHGAHVFAEAHAASPPGGAFDEAPQWLYTVRFDGRELWGEDAEPGTSLSIDAWEATLEPASEETGAGTGGAGLQETPA